MPNSIGKRKESKNQEERERRKKKERQLEKGLDTKAFTFTPHNIEKHRKVITYTIKHTAA